LNALVGGLVWGRPGVFMPVGGDDRRGWSSVVRV